MKRSILIFSVLVLAAPFARAGDDGVKKTIAYVQKLQTESDGFRSHQPKADTDKVEPSLRATSAAVRALKYLGGELPNKDGCIKFVESCWDADAGGFADTPKGKTDVFSTAVGLMAVVELKMPAGKYAGAAGKYLSANAKTFEDIRIAAAGFEAIGKSPPNILEWRAEVIKSTEKDGTFGKGPGAARETASHVVTLLRFAAKPKEPDPFGKALIKVLNDGQHQNGGWGKADSETAYDLETSYRVMRCYVMLKAKPGNVEGVRSFVAKCRNADGGYAVAPGQPSSVSGTYFAAIILHWVKESPK